MLVACGLQEHLRAEHAHGADARAHRAWQARPQRAARLRAISCVQLHGRNVPP